MGNEENKAVNMNSNIDTNLNINANNEMLPNVDNNINENDDIKKSSKIGMIFSILSIILGVTSVIGSIMLLIMDMFIIVVVGIALLYKSLSFIIGVTVLGILATVFGVVGRKRRGFLAVAIIGTILGAISIIVGGINISLWMGLQ
ncbi:MAG: hypothetical protein J6C46_10895 [Clostridia bacterium]|nr:hypothetical protein [Clostridia bacterium]